MWVTVLNLRGLKDSLRFGRTRGLANHHPSPILCITTQKIYVAKTERISLEADLLGTWKTVNPACQKIISEFLGVLKLRHWLAPGRYWNAKLGRRYSSMEVYQIARDLLTCLSIY